MTIQAPPAADRTARLARIEVRTKPGSPDPRADLLIQDAASIGIPIDDVRTADVYLIQGDLTQDQLEHVATRLLADPVTQDARICARSDAHASDHAIIEVHPLPGVMDPAATSVALGINELTSTTPQVSTGVRYELTPASLTHADLDRLATSLLANPVVHKIHYDTFFPDTFPEVTSHDHELRHVTLTTLDDAALAGLSREAHLFLSLAEMRAIREHYRTLDREPTDIELETLAQTWSEHCVHKTLKSTITYRNDAAGWQDPIDWTNRPGHTINPDGSVTIHNLLKSTVAAATHELIDEGLDWALSVFVDNAGIIRFDEHNAVCVKVETHNHPSAIEPYGGAATGIGGCIRDIIGTGLAAKPIANTNVFCVAHPDTTHVPDGCIHPKRVLQQVVAGVRDYGNRMGIPTVNGAVWFDARHIGNPLVFAGCVGVMPSDKVDGHAEPGDLIVALGGRTGRDGIHGATFSSAELEHTSADEFAHAVQIGNPIEEKRLLDAILRARDHQDGCLFNAITDCGAGGFSSAVGEMGEKVGATVNLDAAPLKYPGLSYSEIWISEAQERMVLAVPQDHLPALGAICEEEAVELAVLGTFGTTNEHNQPQLVLNFHDQQVARMSMPFLHDGNPMPTREAVYTPTKPHEREVGTTRNGERAGSPVSVKDCLLELLAHPNIASKHWIIRQYDHEVQGNTIIKPLTGPAARGPSDAAVIQPVPGSTRGLAIACGLATNVGDPDLAGDPYHMALAAIDECVRNLVCVGADPDRIAILDNFCWPSCEKPRNLAALVRAAEGCYDGAKAFRTPFISGKDSLNNQFTTTDPSTGEKHTIEIPPTLLITGVGVIDDVGKRVTMDAKRPGNWIILVGPHAAYPVNWPLTGSTYAGMFGLPPDDTRPQLRVHFDQHDEDAQGAQFIARFLHRARRQNNIVSIHDVSDGGVMVALAEMLIAGSTPHRPIGANLGEQTDWSSWRSSFAEAPSAYLIEVEAPMPHDLALRDTVLSRMAHVAQLDDTGVLSGLPHGDSVPVAELADAWLGTLDW